MTPDELAKSGSEHGMQRALFAWVRWAEQYGFDAANDDASYCTSVGVGFQPVPELRWCHSIPNGGFRDKITAGKMKQEGALSGILDVFLPLPMSGLVGNGVPAMIYAGLYIEMKREATFKPGVRKALVVDRASGSTSNEQDEFIAYARSVGYAVSVCFDWRSAANEIQKYVEAVRKNKRQ